MKSLRALFLLLLLLASAKAFSLPRIAYVGMSALLPGTGELALGKTTRGSIFLGTDILAINAYLVTGRQKNDLISSYTQYATVYAGIPADMNDRYYQHIQQYASSDEFNQFQELMARNYFLIYTYDPTGYAEYIVSNTYTEDEAWSWQSAEHQDHYQSLRRKTQTTKMYQNLSLGVLLLNRAISMIDVALISRNPGKETSLYFSPQSQGIMLNYRVEF